MTGWLSWEYMHSKLDKRAANQFADGEITEEEYEDYSDRIQSLDMDGMQDEYNEFFHGYTQEDGLL